jgi:hypothetical protein
MADRSLYIEIVLDDKGAVAKLNSLDGGMRRVSEGARGAGTSLTSFEAAMVRATAVGNFLGQAVYNLADRGLRFMVGEMGRAITLSTQAQAAFMGLSSVASAFGVDVGAAREAAAALSSDGLMKVSEAALGLKNLLATGFNLPQSVRLLEAFKDAAAFGRQASLDFGYAVVSATEGVKNGNSMVVDNAGVTKNLSVILTEAGFSASAMGQASTDARVRLALFNGILKETAAQTGDAQRLTETYSGQMSKLKTQYELALSVIGSAITENKTVAEVLKFVTGMVGDLNTHLTDNGKAFTLVSDIVIGVVKSFSTFLTVADYVQKVFYYLKASVFAVVQAFINLKGTFELVILRILETIQKVPGASSVLSKLDSTVVSLRDSVARGEGQFDALTTEINANLTAADSNSAAIGRMKHTLGQLTDRLNATRGQTVEYGSAQQRLKTATDAATTSAKEQLKAEKALAKFREERDEQVAQAYRGMVGAQAGGGYVGEALPPGLAAHLAGEGTYLPSRPSYDITKAAMHGTPTAITGGAAAAPFSLMQHMADNLEGIVMQALTGGGSVLKSVGGMLGGGLATKFMDSGIGTSVSGLLENTLGKTIGGALGGLIPGLGAIAGPLLGKVGGWVGGLFGGEGKQTNNDRDAWISSTFGSSDELRKLAAEAGVADAELRKLFSTKKVEDFQAVAERVHGQIRQHATEQEADAARLAAAIQKYGFEFEQLGPKFQQQQLHERAGELIEDWRVLAAAGIEIGVINEKMADTVNDYLATALKVGAEIPAAMKPILQSMIDQGVLVDANGNKVTDLEATGIQFAETMTQGFNRIVDKLTELITRLNGTRDAVNQIPRDITITTRHREVYEGGDRLQEYHRGGAVRAHTGLAIDEVPIIAQAGEGILSRRAMRRIGGAAGLHALNNGAGGAGGDVAAALVRLADAIEDRPVVVEIDGEAVMASGVRATRRRVGHARRY